MTSQYPIAAVLVVDASVLRAAGEGADPSSRMSRAFLAAMREGGFHAISSPELTRGRNRPASRFASRWFSNLVARKRVVFLDDPTDADLRAHLEQCAEVRGGKSPRIKRLSEYLGDSYFNFLAELPELVLLMDESYRYRASAGVRAINELKPLFGLELTATPCTESSRGPVPFKNLVTDEAVENRSFFDYELTA